MKQYFLSHRKSIALTLVYIYASWLLLQIFVGKFGLEAFKKAGFVDSIAAVAYRPYVYRALVPTIVRSISGVVPDRLGRNIHAMFQGPDILPTMATNYTIDYIVFCLLTWGCFVGFAFCIRWLSRRFYPSLAEHVTDLIAPLAALALLPMFFRHVNFVYDPATIVLIPAALICLLQDKYLLYVLVLALCAINKETAILLIPVFMLHAWNRKMNPLLIGLSATIQAAIWAGIYFYIRHSLRDRPGEAVEMQLLSYNLVLPLHQPYAFVWFVVFGGAFVYFIARDWNQKPLFLRQAFIVILIPLTAGLLVVGCIDELRVFYEVYALLFLLMLPTGLRLFEFASAPRAAVPAGQ